MGLGVLLQPLDEGVALLQVDGRVPVVCRSSSRETVSNLHQPDEQCVRNCWEALQQVHGQ